MKIKDIPTVDGELIEERSYQNDLFNSSKDNNTLIVLPTGTGKTLVSVAISLHRLSESEGKKVIFLTPTKPLARQQAVAFEDFSTINSDDIKVLSGEISPNKRGDIAEDAKVICSTPQTIENDIINGRIDLSNVCHMTFDECHRAVGNYSYVEIAKDYFSDNSSGLITGLTASPGSDIDKIDDVCDNLNISNVEVYTEDDIGEYVGDTEERNIWVDLDEDMVKVRDLVKDYYGDVLKELKENDILSSSSTSQPFYKLQKAQGKIQDIMNSGEEDSSIYRCRSLLSEAMQLNQMIEKVETQGMDDFLNYYKNLDSSSTKSSDRIKSSDKINKAVNIAENYDKEHPKLSELKAITAQKLIDGKNVLVFSKSRETVKSIIGCFEDIDKINYGKLIGQNNKEGDPGMSQTEQIDVIEKFDNGEIDVLVSTQVGEEGLDIPDVDLVIFYEPVPSEIRKIQRRGRTGRNSKGECITLIATDDSNSTRDVSYYYASKNKEKKMKENIQKIKDRKDDVGVKQSKLDNYEEESEGANEDEDKIEVIVDSRELKSSIANKLSRDDEISVETDTLDVGDYIVSSECGIERKTVEDFHDTITGDRDFFGQAIDLTNNYNNPIYIIEGDLKELYNTNIHKNAIIGILCSLTVDYGVKIIFSLNEEDTYQNIKTLAQKYQVEKDTEVSKHDNKAKSSMSEKQEYIVSAIPNVGPKTSRRLLNHFNSVKKVINASEEELQEVEKVGSKKASQIYEVINNSYN